MNKRYKENDATPGALYPYDFLTKDDCSPEWENLEKALADPRITNIAISGPYDTGKTSFLKSFFTAKRIEQLKHESGSPVDEDMLMDIAREKIKQGKADFKFVSLPNFFDDEENKKKSEIELQKDIIGQLVYSKNPWLYPDSKIKRLKEYPLWVICLLYVFIWLFVGLLIWSNNSKFVVQYFNSNTWAKIGTLVFGFLLGGILFYFST